MNKSKKKKEKKKDSNRRRTKKRVSTFNLEVAVNIKITPLGAINRGKQNPWYLFVSAIKGQKKKAYEEYLTKRSVMLLRNT